MSFKTKTILCLDKIFISCYLALLMASKTKTASFHDLIRTLFLVLLLRFRLQNQNGKFLCLDQTFAPCCFAWFVALKFETRIFWDLIKTLFLLHLLRYGFKNQKPEVSMTWKGLCFLFLFMVLIFYKGSFYSLTRCLFLLLCL